ncbi:MAG: aldo/keto reductase [Methanobacteriaceae archaeon]|nr:aldo/keto reductase [Methanobacteriaceae archaeon]
MLFKDNLGFGFMRLPKNNKGIDEEEVNKMVDYAINNGFTHFDTSIAYHSGNSEKVLKKAVVDRYPREEYQILDKLPLFYISKKSDVNDYFNQALENLGVDYFDYYMYHDLNTNDYKKSEKLDIFNFLNSMKDEGVIEHLGFSMHGGPRLLDKILTEHPEMEFVLLQLNYEDWNSSSVHSRLNHEVAVKHDIPIIVMEPLRGGSLVNVSPEIEGMFKSYNPDLSVASWGIRFAKSLPNVEMVLSGMSNLNQMIDNVSYMKNFKPLNNKELEIIGESLKIKDDYNMIECTYCGYCLESCPNYIPINQFFKLYNNQLILGLLPANIQEYHELSETFNPAKNCHKCGECQQHCPQNLEVIENLKKVSEVFD